MERARRLSSDEFKREAASWFSSRALTRLQFPPTSVWGQFCNGAMCSQCDVSTVWMVPVLTVQPAKSVNNAAYEDCLFTVRLVSEL